jgi:hypothetical protein
MLPRLLPAIAAFALRANLPSVLNQLRRNRQQRPARFDFATQLQLA